jgi:hypothetical protein
MTIPTHRTTRDRSRLRMKWAVSSLVLYCFHFCHLLAVVSVCLAKAHKGVHSNRHVCRLLKVESTIATQSSYRQGCCIIGRFLVRQGTKALLIMCTKHRSEVAYMVPVRGCVPAVATRPPRDACDPPPDTAHTSITNTSGRPHSAFTVAVSMTRPQASPMPILLWESVWWWWWW